MNNLIIETKPIERAIEKAGESHTKIGHLAGSSPDSLKRFLEQDPNLNLSTITKIASYLGFRTRVVFEPSKAKGAV